MPTTIPLPPKHINNKDKVEVPVICWKCTYIVSVDKESESEFLDIFKNGVRKLKRLWF